MRLPTFSLCFFVALAASSMVACSSSSAPAAEGTGSNTSANTPATDNSSTATNVAANVPDANTPATDSAKPAASGSMVGKYQIVISAEMQKQMDAAMAQLESIKTKDPVTYAEQKKMMEEGMKAAKAMVLEIVDGSKFKMTAPGDKPGVMKTAEGTYTAKDGTVTMIATVVDGKPATEIDKKPAIMTFDSAAGTLSMTESGNTMTFKKV